MPDGLDWYRIAWAGLSCGLFAWLGDLVGRRVTSDQSGRVALCSEASGVRWGA